MSCKKTQLSTCKNFRAVPNTFLHHLCLLPLRFLSVQLARFFAAPPPNFCANHFASRCFFPLPFILYIQLALPSHPPHPPPHTLLLASLFPMLDAFYFFCTTFLALHPALPCSSLSSSLLQPPLAFFTLLRQYTPPFGCARRVVDSRGGLKGVKAES